MIAESPAETALVVVAVIVVDDVTFVVTAKRSATKLAATHATTTEMIPDAFHAIVSVAPAAAVTVPPNKT